MRDKSKPKKGGTLEEILRAYFLRAGFFVVRGIPFRKANQDLGDVDLWLYERPTGTARRIQICDIKYKQRPKAVERLFWTSGLTKALGVDGAYVATTDTRPNLQWVAEKLGIQLIDGTDIQRIQQSRNVLYNNRISDEELIYQLKKVDKTLRNKNLQKARLEIISSVSEGFGAPSAVRALESFSRLATNVVGYPPDGDATLASARLAYLAAAVICESLDYVSIGAAFRSLDERRQLLLNAVRYGELNDNSGQRSLKLALLLIEKYATGGKTAAKALEARLRDDLERIPAEIVTEPAGGLLQKGKLFSTGLDFEMACYHSKLPTFDRLNVATKSMLGALLDFASVDRERFANAWKTPECFKEDHRAIDLEQEQNEPQPSLFTCQTNQRKDP